MLRFTIGCTILVAKFLPHTILLQQNKKFRTHYDTTNNEKPVPANVKEKFEEVVTDANLRLKTENKITLFSVHDLDVFHAGSTFLKHGAIIGVPQNFNYKNADDITADISFPGVNVDWDTKAGREYRKSLILSDNAQKFILAQTILICSQPDLIFEAFALIADIMIAQVVYQTLCLKLHIFKNQRLGRFVYGTICIIGGYINWWITRNALYTSIKSDINEQILQLGPKYVQGAVEYYEKLSQRNKALRALLGVKGTYLFTPAGNETFWFNQKGTSICNQLNYFNAKLQDIQLAS